MVDAAPPQKGKANPLEYFSEKIAEMSRRVRILEDKISQTRSRIEVVDNSLLSSKKAFIEETKEINISLKETKSKLREMHDVINQIIKQLGTYARKKDLDVLEKYIGYFDPTKFITKEEVVKIVNEKVGEK